MNKDKVIEILGDVTWFMGVLILQAHRYDDIKTKDDSILAANMMHNLCSELEFTKDDIITITTFANNKLNNVINMSIDEEEE